MKEIFNLLLRILIHFRSQRGFADTNIAVMLNEFPARDLWYFMPKEGWTKDSIRHFCLAYSIYQRPGPSKRNPSIIHLTCANCCPTDSPNRTTNNGEFCLLCDEKRGQ